MVERKKGLILNVSSASAVLPTPLMTMYSSTKVNIVLCIAYNIEYIWLACYIAYNVLFLHLGLRLQIQ